MKIVNECDYETKLIKDLEPGEVCMHGSYAYMRIGNVPNKVVGYPMLRLSTGEVIYMTDVCALVKLLDAELHIKYKLKKD